MKVLIISHKPPYPPIDGGCRAMANLVEGLTYEGVDIGYMCISTPKHPFDSMHYQNRPHFNLLHQQFINTKPGFLGMLRALFSGNSYLTSRFYCAHFSAEIVQQFSQFKPDIILLESVFSAVYLRDIKHHTSAKVVLRTHNLEADLWQKKVSKSKLFSRLLLQPFVNRLATEEQEIFNQVDGILAISTEEVDFSKRMASATPVMHVPMWIQPKELSDFRASTSFFHVGAMDWEPNISGIQWLMNTVWPHVHTQTSLNFHLAGKELNTADFGLAGVINHGQVTDAQVFMQTGGILVIPLFQASGLRIKLIEAGALGIPVIATPQAVGDIDLVHGEDILIAQTADDFITAMCTLAKDVELQQKLSRGIHAKITQHFSSEKLYTQTIDFLKHL